MTYKGAVDEARVTDIYKNFALNHGCNLDVTSGKSLSAVTLECQHLESTAQTSVFNRFHSGMADRYSSIDYSQLKPIKDLFYGEQVTVIGTIQSVHSRPIRGGKASMIEVVISDGTGGLRLSYFNQPWLANRFKQGDAISVSGKIDQYLGRLVMNSPDWEPVEVESLHTNRIVPVYALTERITQKWLRGQMKQALVEYWAPSVVDALPESVRNSAHLMPLGEALLQIHFPDSQDKLKVARERLAFDEIFYWRS